MNPAESRYHKTEQELQHENVLIEAAKKDPQRFEPIYRRYHEQIFRYVYQRLDSEDKASDVTSQVFLKAMTNLKKYEYRGVPFASWLYRIARNEVYQLFKEQKAQRTVNVESEQVFDIIDELEENPLEEYKNPLMKVISTLSEDDLQIIEMRYFEQRPFKEIAEILEITENNAKVKAYRILGKMKKKFKAYTRQS